ncbi:MAG: SAM-dependent methyltransferase [Muricauda sp.]|nr:SAM-dependent methyltransferase [Allomuricauda sp.]
MEDIFGKALLDYLEGNDRENIKTNSSVAGKDLMPLSYLFRAFEEMPLLEQKALELCKGSVLDIGCGAGPHSLWLQNHGFKVTALDSSKGAIDTCRSLGIEKTVHCGVLDYSGTTFDTLLLLMNGIGIVGRLALLVTYLEHFKKLLNPGGQVLMDSSNIIYMYEEDDDGGVWIPGDRDYYGEVEFTMEYKGQKSPSFYWLYLDFNTLENAAMAHGFTCDLVSQGEHYDYLARLTLKK